MANDLKPYESITRVFWIKIELKDNHENESPYLGDIRDVISGVRSPISNLLDIIDFIIPYMQQMGIRINWFWRLTIWLKKRSQVGLRKR